MRGIKIKITVLHNVAFFFPVGRQLPSRPKNILYNLCEHGVSMFLGDKSVRRGDFSDVFRGCLGTITCVSCDYSRFKNQNFVNKIEFDCSIFIMWIRSAEALVGVNFAILIMPLLNVPLASEALRRGRVVSLWHFLHSALFYLYNVV